MTKKSELRDGRSTTVRARLLMIAVLPFLLLIVAAILVFYAYARPIIYEEYAADLESTLAEKQYLVQTWVRGRSEAVVHLGTLSAARAWDLDGLGEATVRFIESFSEFTAAVFVGPDGNAVIDSSGREGGYVGDRDYFTEAMAGKAVVSDVIVSRISGTRLVVFSAPVRSDEGDVRGVAFAALYLDVLDRLITESTVSRAIDTYLLDSADQLVAGDREPPEDWTDESDEEGSSPPAFVVPSGQPSVYTNCLGDRVLGASAMVPELGWTIVSEVDIDAMVGLFVRYNTALIVTALVYALVLLVMVVLISRSIEWPLRKLDEMSQYAGDGDFHAALAVQMPIRPPAELQRLYTVMRGMVHLTHGRESGLQKEALTDPLTALANRRHLESEGRRLLTMCAMAHAPCSVMVFDADHFKRINDTLGHEAGDQALIALARMIAASLRSGDFLARYGGEEFVAVLPRTDCPSAAALAERVREAVATTADLVPGLDPPLTVSVGVAAVDVPDASQLQDDGGHASERLEQAIAQADRMLYEAKRSGRNRVAGECGR